MTTKRKSRSTCTCKNRPAVHPRNALYPHEQGCPWVEKQRQDADASALSDTARRLAAYYKHKANNG